MSRAKKSSKKTRVVTFTKTFTVGMCSKCGEEMLIDVSPFDADLAARTSGLPCRVSSLRVGLCRACWKDSERSRIRASDRKSLLGAVVRKLEWNTDGNLCQIILRKNGAKVTIEARYAEQLLVYEGDK